MPRPWASAQASSENIPPANSAVMNWVHQQSKNDQASNAMPEAERARLLVATPPRSIQATTTQADAEQGSNLLGKHQPRKMMYDIPTLLRLRDTQSAVPVMLRVKPEAIAENIFQYMGAGRSRRMPTRSRGLSDSSNISFGSTDPHSKPIHPAASSSIRPQPFRQPHAPPETSLLQRHDGFVRFLKQHASPPHHRVTAGGRIVPTGPSSPPPMLDYGSLNALVRERPTIPKSSQKESHATTHAQSAPMMGLGGHLQGQNGNMPGQYGFPQSTMQTAIPYFGYQAVMPSAMQPQVNMTPVGVLPDGTTLVSHNGVSYRVYWNGVNTVMEPSQAIPLPLDQQYYPINYQQTLQNQPQYGTAFVSAPSNQTIPLATATNASPSGPQRKAKSDEEMELKAKLTNLDQHLALNHYDITPAERSNLVAQRRYLVEEIDKLRLSKGQYKHNIPIVAPATTLSTRPMLRHSSGAESNSIPPNSQVGISQKPQVAEGSTINKCLSPAAPPFVPSNHQSFSSATYTVNAQTKLCGKGPALNANGNVSPFTHVHDIDDDASISNSKVATHRHEASFSVLDPSDPAMRVIEYEDIEYAARYLYNWSKDTKTYCTTVAEFQEAIRRVREQARLYGCAGGQSKDPAYDAEQDLWWAICDRDPIPLPAQIPDHVANPRPWNWNDSAFNYRGNPLEYPGPECEKARNSPRVLGLDPSLTESMKDMMDVSRSYFALKGQLPSVPFRDFAYDRDGNRRLIQSETAVSAAYVDPPSKRKAPRPIFTNETEESIPKTCTPSMEALKAPRYIEVSGRHMSRVSLSQPQRAQKQSIPEEVHEPRTLEHSKTHLPIKSSKDQLDASPASKSLHSSKKAVNKSGILDTDDHYYPATPASRRVRSHPKEISTFQENRLSMPPPTIKIQDETFQNGNSELAVGGPMYSSVWGSGTTTGKDIAKAGPEAHQVEIAPKRFEEQNSGRTYRNPKIRANISMEKDSGYPRNRFLAPQTENQGVATRSMERQDRKSSDPEAESKHPWGPEYELTRPHPSDLQRGFWGPLRFDLDVGVHDAAKLPKVNIPDATTMRAPLPREYGTRGDPSGLYKFESQEVSSVKVSEKGHHDSHQFLRKMLKSPHYSYGQPINGINLAIRSALADHVDSSSRIPAEPMACMPGNKENTSSYGGRNSGVIGNGLFVKGRPAAAASSYKFDPNTAINKARSSLASSTYQAHGYLPNFDGASKAHTSSLYHDQTNQPPSPVRVNLPSPAFYGGRQDLRTSSTRQFLGGSSAKKLSAPYHVPVNYGFDGGSDAPVAKNDATCKDKQAEHKDFDYMGVTPDDYETHREDPNNAWHQGAVEDFFQDLAEQESELMSRQRVNTQSAA